MTLLAVSAKDFLSVKRATGIGVLLAARESARRWAYCGSPIWGRQDRMQVAIGYRFSWCAFDMAFSVRRHFVLALIVLGLALQREHSLVLTVLLQRGVEDNFRGRVFAAELALLTLTMAVSNYVTGELLDRFGFSARAVAIGIGAFFLLPGVAWFATERWWDKDQNQRSEDTVPETLTF